MPMRVNNNQARNIFKALFVAAGAVVLLIIGGISQEVYKYPHIGRLAFWVWPVPRKLQELPAPQGKPWSATLCKKNNLGDVNFIVKLNGKVVYISPDYAAYTDMQYRETLLWDQTGTILVLELMGKRVFAFDASKEKRLQKGDLINVKLKPMPSDNDFYATIKDLDE